MKLIFVGAVLFIGLIANTLTKGGTDFYLAGPPAGSHSQTAAEHDSIMEARTQQEIDKMLQASSNNLMKDYQAPKRIEKPGTFKIIR